jgi:NitT/TauT family transport system permease protein
MRHATTVRVALVAGFFLMLEALARFGIVSKRSLVAPSDMIVRLADLMHHQPFWDALAYTALSIVVSLGLAVVAGFAGGVILHRLPRTRRALEPLIASYYALPFFVLYPLFIVLWGMNAIPIIFVGFIYAVMAMLTATLSGLDRIPAVFRRSGRVFQLSPWREALLIQLPAATPYLLTGIKLALGYAITGVIGSEFILSNNGLGYAIAYAYNAFDDRTMYALLLFLIVLVTVVTALLHTAERSAHHRSGAVKIEERQASLRERATAGLVVLIVLFAGWELLHWKSSPAAPISGRTLLRPAKRSACRY